MRISQNAIEQIARKDNEKGHGGEEDKDETPGHSLFQHGGLGERKSDYRHHKGDGSTQWYTFGNENLHHGHDSRSIGIHRHGKDDAHRNGVPTVARQILLEESFGDIAMHEGSYGNTYEDIHQHTTDNAPRFLDNGGQTLGKRKMAGLPFLVVTHRCLMNLDDPWRKPALQLHPAKDDATDAAQHDA